MKRRPSGSSAPLADDPSTPPDCDETETKQADHHDY